MQRVVHAVTSRVEKTKLLGLVKLVNLRRVVDSFKHRGMMFHDHKKRQRKVGQDCRHGTLKTEFSTPVPIEYQPIMPVPKPHFLLFSESHSQTTDKTKNQGQWRFVLESLDSEQQFEAADIENDVQGERLELLAVVRGLEALDQPSKVTLVTPSRYVTRGIRHGMPHWRDTGWKWECFGEQATVKNSDLWKRVDQAMNFHRIDCRMWRFDQSHGNSESTSPAATSSDEGLPSPAVGGTSEQSLKQDPSKRASLIRRIGKKLLKKMRNTEETH